MLSIVQILPGVTIFFEMSLCCSRVVLVVSLCCCIWLLPFPPTWNLIRSWWEMEHKMDKQCCYLVRNALGNRGNPTFPYEDNFSNKILSKYAGPSHKGSQTWARQKLRSVCCKGTLKPLYKRCLTSAKAEIHVQTSGSKDLMPMSIKLSHVHAGCPGTSLAASCILPLVRGVCLGSPPRVLNVSNMCRGDPCSHQNRVTLLFGPLKQCAV